MQAVTEPDAGEPTAALAQSQASAPVLKIPRIELQLADLGTITVRISLTQSALDVVTTMMRAGLWRGIVAALVTCSAAVCAPDAKLLNTAVDRLLSDLDGASPTPEGPACTLMHLMSFRASAQIE
jgi:hypothetical protein